MQVSEALDILQEQNDPGGNSYKYGGYPADQQSYEDIVAGVRPGQTWRDPRPPPTWAEIAILLPQDVPPPPDNRPDRGNASGNSIPALRDDIDAIWAVLESQGIVKPTP